MFYEASGIIMMMPNARWRFLNGQSRESFAPYLYGRIVKESMNLLSKISVPNLVDEWSQAFVQGNQRFTWCLEK
jgi:hypothetical protein